MEKKLINITRTYSVFVLTDLITAYVIEGIKGRAVI